MSSFGARDGARIDQILIAAEQLEPIKFHRQIAEWRRGSLPSDSMPEHVAGGDWKWPIDDRGNGRDDLDRIIDAAQEEYGKAIVEAMTALQRAQAIARNTVPPSDPEERKRWQKRMTESLGLPACVNCERIIARTPKDPVRAGRCSACYEYRRRTGEDRSRELIQQEIERKAEQ